MTTRGALLLLCAGGMAIAGCGGDGAATCGNGQRCGSDGGGGGSGDGGAAIICLNGGPCGDTDGTAAACGKAPPCGGEVVGEWTFVETCDSIVNVAAMKASFATMAEQSWCVGQTLVAVVPQPAGTLAFDAAGTYSLTLTYRGYLDINYPESCLAGLSCDDATAGFQSQIEAGTFPLRSVSSIACAGTSSCLCRAMLDSPRSEAGTYAVAGSVLTFIDTTGAGLDKNYCVAGNSLHILDTVTRSTGQTEIDGDLVAMKR